VAAALPGGDPLAAALAAGETPSPELVAASGETEGLPLQKSVPLALGLAALIIALPFARTNVELHSLVPFELSADALAAKVRDHAAAFGYTTSPADRKYVLHWDWGVIAAAGKDFHSTGEVRKKLQAEPPLQLGYRESPLPLVALPDGDVTAERPAPTVSGMIEAWVNSRGELRIFRAVPPQVDTSESHAVDVQVISKAVGFELSRWQEAAPKYTPRYAFDWLKAWRGRQLVLGSDVMVQAAAWHGRVTDLEVIWPWSGADQMPAAQTVALNTALRLLVVRITSVLVFLFSAFLAARNLQAGRGDRRGAWRLATVYLVLSGAAWVWSTHWTAHISMMGIVATNAANWAFDAALVWLLYVALEPAVRARWPHCIVTWSSALAGRWQDPLVCAHLLYGTLLGLSIAFLFAGAQWLSNLHGQVGDAADADVGVSASLWIADVLIRARQAIEFGLLVVFVIFCFRVLCRKDWIASVAAAVLFTLHEGEVWRGGPLSFAFFLVIFALIVFVLLRLGLVSTMVAIFVVNVMLQVPGAQGLTKPYEWAEIMYPGAVLVLVIWAFWRTSGRQLWRVAAEQR
jgi:serine/threonine-protein kinase